MIGGSPVTWLEAVPALIAALALLTLPGFGALWLARLPWLTALLAAPALTVSAVVVSGVIAGRAGIRWGLLAMLVVTALSWGLGALVGRLGPRTRPPSPAAGWALGSIAIAAVIGVWPLLSTMGRASAIPRGSPDTVFHLGAAMTMLLDGNVSTLHALDYAVPGASGFYPAAFHAFVVMVCQLTGVSVAVGSTAVATVAACVVWPAGCILLARAVLGGRVGMGPATIAAAVPSVAFATYPTWFLGYGVLWPNLFGQALMAAPLALVVTGVRSGADELSPRTRRITLLAAAAAVPGIAVAHPNAVIAFFIFVVVILVVTLLGAAWRNRASRRDALLRLAAAAGLVLVSGAVWGAAAKVAKGLRASNPPGPEMDLHDALVDVFFHASRDARPLALMGLLVALGLLAVVLRYRSAVWVVVAWGVAAMLYLLDTTVDNGLTRLLTWPWYNNSPRLAALLVLPSVVLAAAGLVWLAEGAAALVARVQGPSRAGSWLSAITLSLVVLVTVLTGGADAKARSTLLDPFFHPEPGLAWVTEPGLAALHQLGQRLPPGAVVAGNPFRGGSYLFAASERRNVFPSEKVSLGPPESDLSLIAGHLDEVGNDPMVCAAARRRSVGYALVGGELVSAGSTPARIRRFAGVDGVASSPAFRLVASVGPYRLFRRVACAGS